MSLTKELFLKLMEEFEKYGATDGLVENLVNSPDKIKRMIRFMGDDMDSVSGLTKEFLPAEGRTLIYLQEVVSGGGSGSALVEALRLDHYGVGYEVKMVMCSSSFVSTSGVRYQPVILPGAYFRERERFSLNIDEVASGMGLVTPPIELAHLLRRMLSTEDVERMGFTWLTVMHELVILPNQDEGRTVLVKSVGYPSLHMFIGGERREWRKETGFVYLAPKPQEK